MHTIRYENAQSDWSEALPLGNGHFGAMAYYNGGELTYALNHYDVYFGKLKNLSASLKNIDLDAVKTDLSRYERIMARALEARRNPDDPAHMNYNHALADGSEKKYGSVRTGQSMPMAGELRILLGDAVSESAQFENRLEMEEARHAFAARTHCGEIRIDTIAAQACDVLMTRIHQDVAGLARAVAMVLPERKFIRREAEFTLRDSHTACMAARLGFGSAEGRALEYAMAVRVEGASFGAAEIQGDGFVLALYDAQRAVRISTSVAVREGREDSVTEACRLLDEASGRAAESVREDHGRYWRAFWSRSSISIPDQMLENLWYMGLYQLECCCGKGSSYPEHACGLNGLWDIMQPTQWGSMWYWDVNIQQSFWPVYTANHTEIGRCFYDGLLCYADAARAMAKALYGLEGYSSDYPFKFYMPIWPWCAQFFWWHYLYTGDTDFLREKAYPLFSGILKFWEGFLKRDEETGMYYIFPDISPEEGPVTRNSTITLACLKYLLRAAIAANGALDGPREDARRWRDMLDRLPEYPLCESGSGRKMLRNSEWADAELKLAHGSMLMPVYPVGDISVRSDAALRQLGVNTLASAGDRLNLSTHVFVWEACAAARLGLGGEAVRLLYEKGIAYGMRPNGLFAEETDRWMQNCVVALLPAYHPPLTEASGGVAAAVNEMLLQSFGGAIHVFPAVPRGESPDGSSQTPAWKDCGFESLLAEGAFEVSAAMRDGSVVYVGIKSLHGNPVRLMDPFGGSGFTVECGGLAAEYAREEGTIRFETRKGRTYVLRPAGVRETKPAHGSEGSGGSGGYAVYTAPSGRRVFWGKDRDTDYLRALDAITFDYWQGDARVPRASVYRVDFSRPGTEMPKDYTAVLPRQYHACGKIGLDFLRVTAGSQYSVTDGFGFRHLCGLTYSDRGKGDPFRRDFVGGTAENELLVYLARGQYQLFVVSGDYDEETATILEAAGQRWETGLLAPARFGFATLPVRHESDGPLGVRLAARRGCAWKLNLMIINRLL